MQQVQFSYFIFLHTLQSLPVEKLSKQTSLQLDLERFHRSFPLVQMNKNSIYSYQGK